MKSYITYKNQLEGIKDVSETVKTVEKIAASSVHFLKQEVANLDIYGAEIEKALARLSLFYQKKKHPLLLPRKKFILNKQKIETEKKALIILTGNKGLVGGLWHKIVNSFLDTAKQYQSVIMIGAKGKNYLKEENIPIIKSFTNFFDIPTEEEIKNITDYIFNEFKKGAFFQVDILYPKFVSLAQQTPNFTLFLPFEFTRLESREYNNKNFPKNKLREQQESSMEFESKNDKNTGDGFPIFEPSKQKIFDNLLQKYIGTFFYKIIMETKLSELSARTVAMEHAATKTKELIQKLTLDYTKQRHRIVTQRQLESFVTHKIT